MDSGYQAIKESLRRLYLDDARPWLVGFRGDEAGDAAFLLKRKQGQQVQLSGNRDFWPDKTHLAWHRENRFNWKSA